MAQGTQMYVPPVPPVVTKTNGFAVASLVLGIVWAYWVGSVLAVIFGHVALAQMKRVPTMAGKGLAIAGLVLGYIGVGTLILTIIIAASASTGSTY